MKAFNSIAQGYVDWFNLIGLPIYSGLSGSLLDWIGSGIYGLQRPTIGVPAGSVYNTFNYNTQKYGTGGVTSLKTSDDIYKRILTWKMFRGDGFYTDIRWIKRRLMRFIVGVDGTTPAIIDTSAISVLFGANNILDVSIHYPNDQASVDLLFLYLQSGLLDMPFQYTLNARSV